MKIQSQQKLILLTALLFVSATNLFSQSAQNKIIGTSISDVLASVNEQPITVADIDPEIQKASLEIEPRLLEMRKKMLEDKINEYLIEAEAKLKGMTKQQYIALEVLSKVRNPTPKEIQDVYDTNREAFGDANVETAKRQIVNYLKNERAQKQLDELALRLRKTHKVVMGVDVNRDFYEPNVSLALVEGRAISAADMLEKFKPIIYDFRIQLYEAQKAELDKLIYNRLIIDEAKKRNVGSEEIIRTEISEKFRYPTEEEIKKFYDENKVKVAYQDARGEISRYLENLEQARLERALSDKLKTSNKVQIFLIEPVPPVQRISTADAPSQGDVNAPVTVVMFTDFQCPVCSRMHPIVTDVLKQYGNKVRFVVRDFPLEDLHPQARRAAEAAAAANAQGKFFEYIEILYKNQKALDDISLKKYATQIGLNRVKFDAAFMTRKFAMEVQRDLEDGVAYGVKGTPTIFVNGVRVRELTAEAFQVAIDNALKTQKGVSQK